jgi:hypothetical protein
VGVSMVRLKVQGNEVDAGADAIGAQGLDEPARIRRRESLGTALCLADEAARIIARTAAVAVDAALLPKPSTLDRLSIEHAAHNRYLGGTAQRLTTKS